MVRLKRAYEPAADADGRRVLVERLWPRGIAKDEAHLDAWMKDVAPSAELRKWYGHDTKRWPEFRRRYTEELQSPGREPLLHELAESARKGDLTLIYATHDTEHSGVIVLREYLKERFHV